MKEIYVSVDVETDGPIPGRYSLLNLGAAAFSPEGGTTPIATWEGNFTPLPEATQHPDTMAWWAKQDPAVWASITENAKDPTEQMAAFDTWVRALPGSPVLVTYPSWDQMWVSWYFTAFLGANPFGLGGLDLKSYAMAALQRPTFRGTTKSKLPRALFAGAPPHTHRGLDDAIGQGVFWMNLRNKTGG